MGYNRDELHTKLESHIIIAADVDKYARAIQANIYMSVWSVGLIKAMYNCAHYTYIHADVMDSICCSTSHLTSWPEACGVIHMSCVSCINQLSFSRIGFCVTKSKGGCALNLKHEMITHDKVNPMLQD